MRKDEIPRTICPLFWQGRVGESENKFSMIAKYNMFGFRHNTQTVTVFTVSNSLAKNFFHTVCHMQLKIDNIPILYTEVTNSTPPKKKKHTHTTFQK